MPETMIERIRNAIVADIKRQGDDDRGPWVGGMLSAFPDHTGIEVDGDLDPLSIARAVLTAMREPTDNMAGAGAGFAKSPNDDHMERKQNAEWGWQAMIDAALAEDAR